MRSFKSHQQKCSYKSDIVFDLMAYFLTKTCLSFVLLGATVPYTFMKKC